MRFPDEIVFHESIKESDGEAVIRMLRRVSVDIDINRITMSGMTAIHQVEIRAGVTFQTIGISFTMKQTRSSTIPPPVEFQSIFFVFRISKFIKVNFTKLLVNLNLNINLLDLCIIYEE